MFSLDFGFFVFLYLLSGFVLIFALWFFYDHRDRQLYDRERLTATFHCVRCGHLYAARKHTKVSSCPRCAFDNTRLKF